MREACRIAHHDSDMALGVEIASELCAKRSHPSCAEEVQTPLLLPLLLVRLGLGGTSVTLLVVVGCECPSEEEEEEEEQQ